MKTVIKTEHNLPALARLSNQKSKLVARPRDKSAKTPFFKAFQRLSKINFSTPAPTVGKDDFSRPNYNSFENPRQDGKEK
jgi:hypothetical protein